MNAPSDPTFTAIVLAAGQGTRMKSVTPKVLHRLCGRPMLSYPVQAALDGGADRVVVVIGHAAQDVQAELASRFDDRVCTALQPTQNGSGDAARCGADAAGDTDWLLILNGDIPLVTSQAVEALMAAAMLGPGPLGLLTASVQDATGYGRILRDDHGQVIAIREQRDCSEAETAISEFNPGVYVVRRDFFARAIGQLTAQNAQGELYLTDLVQMAAAEGPVSDVPWNEADLHGVNDRLELSMRESDLRARIAAQHALAGVTIRDPASTFIDADVIIEPDAVIEAQVSLRGQCRIGSAARIDVGCVLTNVEVAAGATLLPYSVATDSRIGENARVGPFSHLRPETELGPEARIGNFVETKKTRIGKGSKANHLAYLGDGEIGENVNVGCGTIFCNYDGFQKHLTVLKDDAFIGSDSQLVAPVTVGKNSYVATGTTVTQDVPDDALAIGRARQANKPGLGARLKKKLAADKKKQQG